MALWPGRESDVKCQLAVTPKERAESNAREPYTPADVRENKLVCMQAKT